MTTVLSPPKAVLLAAHFTATGDITSLASLVAKHGDVLRKTLVLRLLLTYLPTHLKTEEYLPLLQSLDTEDFTSFFPLQEVDTASIQSLSDDQAAKKVKKLRLQQLSLPSNGPISNGFNHEHPTTPDPDEEEPEDHLALFLIQRAYAVDSGAGALPELPGLLAPFLDRSPRLRTWTISVLLPFLRRNCEYYPDYPIQQTLADFEHLPDRLAVARLLSQTGVRAEHAGFVGRDLRGLIGPWIYNERRWTSRTSDKAVSSSVQRTESQNGQDKFSSLPASLCPGWEEVLQWLTTQASKSWKVAVNAVEQWDGPSDVDLGGFGTMWLDDSEQQYLEQRYARAALASVYLIPDTSVEAMTGAHSVVSKIIGLLDQDPIPPLPTAASLLSPISSAVSTAGLLSPRYSTYLRNDLLDESNPLTSPSHASTELLHALILSAFLLHRMGTPCTVRQAGELALLRSERDQKAEVAKLIHWISSNGPKGDDRYWIKARNEILWLRDWGAEEEANSSDSSQSGNGVFGQVQREFIEIEFLKALLANTRYSLARALYEDSPDHPLSRKQIQETVFAAAMSAYDNASNPNRTRGGLKKCDEIIHAFPKTVDKSLPATRRAEALLAATHSLSNYRLVLKQGEPFTPVVLRVHQDPISIVGKVLEQNPRSYTKIQEFVDVAASMVDAGLTVRDKAGKPALTPEQAPALRALAERRVTAMCIDAALAEDDFETAYSYVVGRLATIAEPPAPSSGGGGGGQAALLADTWSWRAALAAGKYRRTERTVPPTHLGLAGSANLDIRHLEQRVECLAAALRIAPADTLQEILGAYRRCEEELEAAVQAEDEQASAWDDAADWAWQQQESQNRRKQQQQPQRPMPGGFGEPSPAASGRSSGGGAPLASRMAAAAAAAATSTYGGQPAARAGPGHQRRQSQAQASSAGADDAPLSLFDLSRATARAAQRNFSALSSLRQTRQLVGFGGGGEEQERDVEGNNQTSSTANAPPVRKRDQLREAAMGTLTTGVGWLIGAQPVDRNSGSNVDRD